MAHVSLHQLDRTITHLLRSYKGYKCVFCRKAEVNEAKIGIAKTKHNLSGVKRLPAHI